MSDTPETDAFIASQNHSPTTHQLKNFARILERERDRTRQLLVADAERVDAYLGVCTERDEARTELEMWRDGNILHEVHRDELEKTERERDEAQEKAERYRLEANSFMLQRDEARNELLKCNEYNDELYRKLKQK